VPWVFFTTLRQIQLGAQELLATGVSPGSNFRTRNFDLRFSQDKLKAPASSGAFLCRQLTHICGWHKTDVDPVMSGIEDKADRPLA
jgi:hypothetical protein